MPYVPTPDTGLIPLTAATGAYPTIGVQRPRPPDRYRGRRRNPGLWHRLIDVLPPRDRR